MNEIKEVERNEAKEENKNETKNDEMITNTPRESSKTGEDASRSRAALMNCFIKAYHYKTYRTRVFADIFSSKLLKKEEYQEMGDNIAKEIEKIEPNFKGTDAEALQWIMKKYMAPTVLARSFFEERKLIEFLKKGCKQYLIVGSAYETFAYRMSYPGLKVFEIDEKKIIVDKRRRLLDLNIKAVKINFVGYDFKTEDLNELLLAKKFQPDVLSFVNLPGITYYLTKEEFTNMIQQLAKAVPKGSGLALDYPTTEINETYQKNCEIKSLALEERRTHYQYPEMYKILKENGFLVIENLNEFDISRECFHLYNMMYPAHKMEASLGVNFCWAIKM